MPLKNRALQQPAHKLVSVLKSANRTTLATVLVAIIALAATAALRLERRVHAGNKSVLDMETIPRTPERLARGKYLVEGLAQCTFCHSDIDFTKRPIEVVPGMRNGGTDFGDLDLGPPNHLYTPNISPDPEFGSGKWKDADFVRALRQGIGHDGRTLIPLMPYRYFREMSDEDLASVIVYERSLPPVHVERPKRILPEPMLKALEPLPPVEHVPEPGKTNRVAYGKYLVTVGHCSGCHTPIDEHGKPLPGMEFAGGQPLPGPWTGDPKKIIFVSSLNLTPDPSGIPYFDEAMFIDTIRAGQLKGRELSTIMPWSYFRNLSDDDLKAIFAYLKTLKPVQHLVDNTEPPTYCKVCRTKHGLGDRN